MNRVAQKGFTLIELLIAMTILLMVLYIGSYSYGNYSRIWHKEIGDFDSTFEQTKGITLLFSIIKNLKPYIIRDGQNKPFHYFEGGKSVIRSVTQRSLSDPGFPAVFEIVVEQQEQHRQLIYRERPLKGIVFRNERTLPSMTFETVLIEGFDDLQFEFKGSSDYLAWLKQNIREEPTDETWYGYYSGKDTLITPTTVKFTVQNDLGTSSLQIPVTDFSNDRFKTYFVDEEF